MSRHFVDNGLVRTGDEHKRAYASLGLNGLFIQQWTSFYPTPCNADIEEALCGIEIGNQLTLRYALYTAKKLPRYFEIESS